MGLIKLSEPELGVTIGNDIAIALARKEVGYVGSYIDSFRRKLENFVQHPHINFFSSGTACLHLALQVAGVERGDEVICQSFTFAASANPIAYLGARPVFVGSEQESWNMCPLFLEEALLARQRLGKKVKAIIPVHLYGMPAKFQEIKKVAERFGVPIIEDAAEALGSKIGSSYCGTLGEFGVYSFNANKIITTGGGGALWGKRQEDIRKASFLALQAKDPAPHYQHSQLGYNYAFSNLNAVLGNAQMDVLTHNIQKRRGNYKIYWDKLGGFNEVVFQPERDGDFSNRWLTAILLPDAGLNQKLKVYLEDLQVETRPLWKPMHLQPIYKHCPYYGDRTEESMFARGICLPSGSGLSLDEVEWVGDNVSKFLKERV